MRIMIVGVIIFSALAAAWSLTTSFPDNASRAVLVLAVVGFFLNVNVIALLKSGGIRRRTSWPSLDEIDGETEQLVYLVEFEWYWACPGWG